MSNFEPKTHIALAWIIGLLESHAIPYQIVGGFAARLFGSTRTLNDIDIDIAEKSVDTLLPHIRPYIVAGPEHYRDEKWDGGFITLNYSGQEIDLGSLETIRISNKARTAWLSYYRYNFETITIPFDGLHLRVMHPRNLAAYKSELDGDHQLLDIQAAQNYLCGHPDT